MKGRVHTDEWKPSAFLRTSLNPSPGLTAIHPRGVATGRLRPYDAVGRDAHDPQEGRAENE